MTSSRGNYFSPIRCNKQEYSNGKHHTKPIKASGANKPPVKKSVRFFEANKRSKSFRHRRYDEPSIEVKYLPTLEEQDKKNLYFSNIDKRKFREDAFEVAIETSKRDNELCELKHNQSSYTSLLTRAFEACGSRNGTRKESEIMNQLSEEEKEFFLHCVGSSHSHIRGLEKHTIECGIKEKRIRLRKSSVRSYIEEYAIIMANSGYLSPQAEASLIESYRRSSAPSQKFARLMAQVDEEVVTLERKMEDHQQQEFYKGGRHLESPRTVVEDISPSSDSTCCKQLFYRQEDNKPSTTVMCH